MSTAADEREQELAWEEWALSRHSRRQRKGRMIIACVFAVLITLVTATGAFIAPKPSFKPSNQSTVYTSDSAIEDPVFSPDGLHIVFSCNASGNFEIWETTAQGRHLTRLTYMHGDSLSPQFSPDGKQIAFYHVDGGSRSILVMSSEGGEVRSMVQVADNTFAWSPDGRFIAFDGMSDGQGQVVAVLSMNTGGIVFEANGTSPAWNRDSRSVLFVAQSSEVGSTLAIGNLTESYAHLVNVTGLAMYPQFLNSTSVVFLNQVNDSWGIRIARLQMNVTTLIVTSVADLLQGLLPQYLSLLPPGTRIPTLTPTIGAGALPVVQPTGELVVFVSTNQSGTSLFEAQMTRLVAETGEYLYIFPVIIVQRLTPNSFDSIGVPSWSLDGNRVVFSAMDSTGKHDVVVVLVAPTAPVSAYGG
jgi:Tol biopolymer transport system component